MAGGAGKVVSCGVRFNARTGKWHAKLTKQEPLGATEQYVKYQGYFATWDAVAAWFATY